MAPRRELRLSLAIAAALVVGVGIAFAAVGEFGYVSYDDPRYVAENYRVRSGLSFENFVWALTTLEFANWHPLTWLSYMLDRELFGEAPGAQHRVNVGLHVANALLLFAGLRWLTGALWASAFAAGLFALHPLHVESVAWISERKDLLSTFFGLLSIGAYAAYVRRRTSKRPCGVAYGLCFALLVLGLMAKPMLVTWPFVFLLLDYWPLCRTGSFARGGSRVRALRGLLVEKVPFFAVALASSVLTLIAQQHEGALMSVERVSLAARAANAAIAYVAYLAMTLWPVGLAPLYPHPNQQVSEPAAFAALAFLAVSTLLLLRASPKRRYLGVGWLFYLGTLVPVIGIVQVGAQAMADRYTYVPLIGVFVALGFGLRDLVLRWPRTRTAAAIAASVLLATCVGLTRAQVAHWRDSLSLFRHTLAHTRANPLAHIHLASALQESGRWEEAGQHYQAALELRPADPYALIGLGNVLLRAGRNDEARAAFERALASRDDFAEALIGIGNYHMAQRNAPSAYAAFQRAIALDPESPEAYNNAGAALASGGELRAAVPFFEEALRLNPRHGDAARNLAAARSRLGPTRAPPR